jgi:5-methylcytosine-specific restriction endonuclease McrA
MPTEDVHHIDGDKSNVAEENLMALCHRHHSQVTTAMGQAWGKRARG